MRGHTLFLANKFFGLILGFGAFTYNNGWRLNIWEHVPYSFRPDYQNGALVTSLAPRSESRRPFERHLDDTILLSSNIIPWNLCHRWYNTTLYYNSPYHTMKFSKRSNLQKDHMVFGASVRFWNHLTADFCLIQFGI